MKLCSFILEGRAAYGARLDDGRIVDLSSRLGAEFPDLLSLIRSDGLDRARGLLAETRAGEIHEGEVEYLPLLSGDIAIHCIGLNYAAHTAEAGVKQPGFPRTFIKIPAALVGHLQPYEKPLLSPQFDFEGELAVVIGKTARGVKAEEAADYIVGYTCFMDGSVRDWQLERTLDQGKNFYRSSSMGPCLVTVDEVGLIDKLSVTTIVSGKTMQHSSFDKMIFSVPKLIEYISSFTELRPGDVIATGTPEGVGFKRQPPRYLQSGDRVEVIIDKVGSLINDVA
jgi:2-keto-4-pentenoate hydratase/2-oxohepta-3-ene-1,7-dioic acid hydratase in catechol pathway